MKNFLLLTFLLWATTYALAQEKTAPTNRSLPLMVGVQFHSLALPLRDVKTSFSNVGVFVGTELLLNRKSTLVQQLSVGWQSNRSVGSGMMVMTQTAWRPRIVGAFYTELKAGVGGWYIHHPTDSWRPANGEWVQARNSGKWLPLIPVGISVGLNPSRGLPISPFISYQLFVAGHYNPSAPLVPNQLLQAGSRIHF
ncbi:hypothetical protein [Telluribacter sp. SYSU D00476]|uniref:hypothetical protein n=1 Tax=Telluribacter sp. SYSU D00476 TaxID=2811430 RepID=UPI001FF2B16A|nr:hypothetical protein [Telluribacter sp. SYSU D00476]